MLVSRQLSRNPRCWMESNAAMLDVVKLVVKAFFPTLKSLGDESSASLDGFKDDWILSVDAGALAEGRAGGSEGSLAL